MNVLTANGFVNDGGTYSDWDLLWSHDYPFNDKAVREVIAKLKPHQKVSMIQSETNYTRVGNSLKCKDATLGGWRITSTNQCELIWEYTEFITLNPIKIIFLENNL